MNDNLFDYQNADLNKQEYIQNLTYYVLEFNVNSAKPWSILYLSSNDYTCLYIATGALFMDIN